MKKSDRLMRWLAISAASMLMLATVERIAAAERAVEAFSPAALVAPPRDGWRTNGGNYFNQRYSPLTAINRGNVAQLKGVWRTHLKGSGVGPQYSGAAQPIVHDGRVYVVTGANDVFALDVATGSHPLAVRCATRPGDLHRLLRLDEPRRGARRRQGVLRRARRSAGRARQAHRQGGLVRAG